MSSHIWEKGIDPEVIGTIWFDDVSSYPQTVALIEEVSELLWGANDDGTREPFTIEESIERMEEYTCKSHAWDLLVEHFYVLNSDMDSDTQEKYEMRELMNRIWKEVKGVEEE
jgi:hypothetical protein